MADLRPKTPSMANNLPATLTIGVSTILLLLSSSCLIGLHAPSPSPPKNPSPPPINKTFTTTLLTLSGITLCHSLLLLLLLIFRSHAASRKKAPTIPLLTLITSFLGALLWGAMLAGARIYLLDDNTVDVTTVMGNPTQKQIEHHLWQREKIPALTVAGSAVCLVGYIVSMLAGAWGMEWGFISGRKRRSEVDEVGFGEKADRAFRESSTSMIGGTKIIPLGPGRGRPVNLVSSSDGGNEGSGVVGIGGGISARSSGVAMSEFPLDSLLENPIGSPRIGNDGAIMTRESSKEIGPVGAGLGQLQAEAEGGKLILPHGLDIAYLPTANRSLNTPSPSSIYRKPSEQPGFIPGRVLYGPGIREFKPPVESRYQKGVFVGAENLKNIPQNAALGPSKTKKQKQEARKSKFEEEFSGIGPSSPAGQYDGQMPIAIPQAIRHPSSARASIWDIHPALRQDLGVGPIDPYTTGAPLLPEPIGVPSVVGIGGGGAWYPPPPVIPLRRIWSAPPGGITSPAEPGGIGYDLELGLGTSIAGGLQALHPPRPISDGYTAAATAAAKGARRASGASSRTVSSGGGSRPVSIHLEKNVPEQGTKNPTVLPMASQQQYQQSFPSSRHSFGARWSSVDLNAPLPPLPISQPSPPLTQGKFLSNDRSDPRSSSNVAPDHILRIGSVTRKPVPTPRLSIGIPISPSSSAVPVDYVPTPISPQMPAPPPPPPPQPQSSPNPLRPSTSQASLTYHKPRRSSNLATGTSITAEDVERASRRSRSNSQYTIQQSVSPTTVPVNPATAPQPPPQVPHVDPTENLEIALVSRQTTFTEEITDREGGGESSGRSTSSSNNDIDPEKLLGLLQEAAEEAEKKRKCSNPGAIDPPEMTQVPPHMGTLIAGRPSISRSHEDSLITIQDNPPLLSQDHSQPLRRSPTGGSRRHLRRLSAPPSSTVRGIHLADDDDTPPPPIPPRAPARLWKLSSPTYIPGFTPDGIPIPHPHASTSSPPVTPPPPPPPFNPARVSTHSLRALQTSPQIPPIPPIPQNHLQQHHTPGTRTVSAPMLPSGSASSKYGITNPNKRFNMPILPLTITKHPSQGSMASPSTPHTPTTPISAARCIGSFTVSPITGEIDVLKITGGSSSEASSPEPPAGEAGGHAQPHPGPARSLSSVRRRRSKSVGAVPVSVLRAARADADDSAVAGMVRFDITRNEVFEGTYGSWSTSTGSGTLGTGTGSSSGTTAGGGDGGEDESTLRAGEKNARELLARAGLGGYI